MVQARKPTVAVGHPDYFDARAEEDGCTKCGHPDAVIEKCPCGISYMGGFHGSKCPRFKRVKFHEKHKKPKSPSRHKPKAA